MVEWAAKRWSRAQLLTNNIWHGNAMQLSQALACSQPADLASLKEVRLHILELRFKAVLTFAHTVPAFCIRYHNLLVCCLLAELRLCFHRCTTTYCHPSCSVFSGNGAVGVDWCPGKEASKVEWAPLREQKYQLLVLSTGTAALHHLGGPLQLPLRGLPQLP